MILNSIKPETIDEILKFQSNFSKSMKAKNIDFEIFHNECYTKKQNLGLIRLVKPQTYGPAMQKLHTHHFDKSIKSVPPGLDKGDFKQKIGTKHFEFKFSAANIETGKTNFVQIRLWQNVDYVLEVLTQENSLRNFYIPSSEMKKLIKKHGGLAHGTKEATKENKNKEYALRPKIGDALWKSLERFEITREGLEDIYATRGTI